MLQLRQYHCHDSLLTSSQNLPLSVYIPSDPDSVNQTDYGFLEL